MIHSSRSLLACACAAAIALAGTVTGGSKDVPAGFDQLARPFIAQHCLSCHGEKQARAGFRIDLLTGDFAKPKMAEQWKEVIDRINTGEMPPKGKRRPDVKEAAALVAWVNQELRAVELAAKSAGGRIPMRRLNRDEYANTVRDLLKLDELIVRPLIE